MSFRQFVLHLSSQASWVWGILTPIIPESPSDMMVRTTFQELWYWSFGDPVTWCHSFSARLSIHPWGNCKTYSTSYSWWILRVSKVWSSPDDHVNAISKHVYGTPIFNRNIWSPMLNVSCSITQTPLYGQCHENSLPYLKSFLHYILSWISCSACPWEGYTLEICV